MPPKDALTKLLVRQAIDALNAISKSVEQLKSEMRTLAAQFPEYPVVMGMRGVEDPLGPQLMAEIGDVTRFTHRGSITSLGKPYLVYMTAGANKFLRIYYGRVKEYLASLETVD